VVVALMAGRAFCRLKLFHRLRRQISTKHHMRRVAERFGTELRVLVEPKVANADHLTRMMEEAVRDSSL